jgi:carboxylesterase
VSAAGENEHRVPDPGPFDLRPSEGAARRAVLCIHGLTGTPWEVRPIAEALVARGFRARGPVLPGHSAAEGPKGLAQRSYHDWLDGARRELHQLQREHEEVYVVGMSLGGVLTLLLASEEKLAAAAVVGVPLRFRGALPLAVAVARFFKPLLPKKNGSDISDQRARAVHPGMAAMPLASVHELVKLQKLVRSQLARVRTPLFVGHGALDHTARPADAVDIASGVGSDEVVRRIYERSGHIVPVDFDGAELAADIVEFFCRER